LLSKIFEQRAAENSKKNFINQLFNKEEQGEEQFKKSNMNLKLGEQTSGPQGDIQ